MEIMKIKKRRKHLKNVNKITLGPKLACPTGPDRPHCGTLGFKSPPEVPTRDAPDLRSSVVT